MLRVCTEPFGLYLFIYWGYKANCMSLAVQNDCNCKPFIGVVYIRWWCGWCGWWVVGGRCRINVGLVLWALFHSSLTKLEIGFEIKGTHHCHRSPELSGKRSAELSGICAARTDNKALYTRHVDLIYFGQILMYWCIKCNVLRHKVHFIISSFAKY